MENGYLFEHQYQRKRSRKRKAREIGVEAEVDIVHDVKVLKKSHSEVAGSFNVSEQLVQRLIFKMKHDDGYIRRKLQ